MRIGFVTTLGANIGDDFIREGLMHVFAEVSPRFEAVLLNKHAPCSLYHRTHPVHWPAPLPRRIRWRCERFVDALTYRLGHSVFDECDAIVQSGAPVYFRGCATTEWSKMVWEHVVCRLAPEMPAMNLAAGACYPWEQIPDEIPGVKDQAFVAKISKACRLTTVRDVLAQRLLSRLGYRFDHIPCSAFLAALRYPVDVRDPKYIFVNYMHKGTHFDFGQGINPETWEQEMRRLIQLIRKFYPVAFICHNEDEFREAGRLEASVPRYFPKTVPDYLRVASMGIAGIFNRMHAAVAFAGLGIPSIGVGGDTRMLMVEGLGLETVFVKEARADVLIESLETLLHDRVSAHDRLLELQRQTLHSYKIRVGDAIG